MAFIALKTILLTTLLAIVALGDEVVLRGEPSQVQGLIRAAYIDQNNLHSTDTYASSIGGILKYETAPLYDLQFGLGAYVSQKVHPLTGSFAQQEANGDFFAQDTGSYTYIGEVYAQYKSEDLTIRIGRQNIETPLLAPDDIRMHPNTFEAAFATYKGLHETILSAGYVGRWAGYDSGGDISKFKKLAGGKSKGVALIGIQNSCVKNLTLQGWYYNMDKFADAFYSDIVYEIPFYAIASVELNAQFALFDEKKDAFDSATGLYNIPSNINGEIYGFATSLHTNILTLHGAYNQTFNATDKKISNGFGGWPYLTSMEEVSIAEFTDAKAYKLSTHLDIDVFGQNRLHIHADYADFQNKTSKTHVKEFDSVATYTLGETMNMELSYANVDDINNNTKYNGSYERLLVRLNYKFTR
ncbi:MAG: OprD family outer membrane porin [Helicobacteraceae bacterium]|nr:OprD family outer membrane porin [Helicobacteraceae bacterium]